MRFGVYENDDVRVDMPMGEDPEGIIRQMIKRGDSHLEEDILDYIKKEDDKKAAELVLAVMAGREDVKRVAEDVIKGYMNFVTAWADEHSGEYVTIDGLEMRALLVRVYIAMPDESVRYIEVYDRDDIWEAIENDCPEIVDVLRTEDILDGEYPDARPLTKEDIEILCKR